MDFCYQLGRILTDKILDNSVQARCFVYGQAAISGDRYNVDWLSLILGNDKKKNKIKETSNKRGGEYIGRNQKEQEKLKRLLVEEIAAKKRKLIGPGGQMLDTAARLAQLE